MDTTQLTTIANRIGTWICTQEWVVKMRASVDMVFIVIISDVDLILSLLDCPIRGILPTKKLMAFTEGMGLVKSYLAFENEVCATISVKGVQKDAYITADFENCQRSTMKKSVNITFQFPQVLIGSTDYHPKNLKEIKEVTTPKGENATLTHDLEVYIHATLRNQHYISGTRVLDVASQIKGVIENKSEVKKP